jgi:hypothetical protein
LDGNYHCADCEEDRQARWDARPYPRFTYFRTKHESNVPQREIDYLGIELEAELPNGTYPESIAEKLRREWIYFQEDGSLRNGIEIVTHPLSFAWIKENEKSFSNLLGVCKQSKLKSYSTDTCGIHVHISNRNFSTLDIYKLLRFFYSNRLFLLQVSQRKEKYFDQWSALDHNTREDLKRKAKEKYSGNKYEALNLTHSYSMECRIFRGTLHYPSLMKNIEFVHAAGMFAKQASLKTCVSKEAFKSYVSENKKLYHNLQLFLQKKGY